MNMALFSSYGSFCMGACASVALSLVACGTERRLVLGDAPDAADERSDGDDGADSDLDGEDAGALDAGSSRLLVSFRAPAALTGNVVALACVEECVDVEVVIEGGTPPYQLSWDDGTTASTRSVCAGSGSYTIKVSDSGGVAGEFTKPRLEAQASLNVTRGTCSDAAVDAQVPEECRVVSAAQFTSCAGAFADDYAIQMEKPLRAGQEYEFHFEFEVSGYGTWMMFGAQERCVESQKSVYGGSYGLADVLRIPAIVCQTFAEDVSFLNLINTALPLGTTKVWNLSVCGGCPSGNRWHVE